MDKKRLIFCWIILKKKIKEILYNLYINSGSCVENGTERDHTESAVGPQSQRDGAQRNESRSPRFT